MDIATTQGDVKEYFVETARDKRVGEDLEDGLRR